MYQYTCLNPISPMGLEAAGGLCENRNGGERGRDSGEKRIHA